MIKDRLGAKPLVMQIPVGIDLPPRNSRFN